MQRFTAATAPISSSTMKPDTPSSSTSGTEPRLNAITGVPQAIASIITRPNGSGQSIGNSSACAPPRKSAFWLSLISPMNSTSAASISGVIPRSKYSRSAESTLAAILSVHAARPAIADGAYRRAFPAICGQGTRDTSARPAAACSALRQAVIDGRQPIRLRQRMALRVGNRNHRRGVERVEDRLLLRQIEPAVQRRHERRVLALEQRERVIVHVEMQHVELVGAAADHFHQQHVRRDAVADCRVEAQRARPDGFESRFRLRIAGCEERHVVAELDERLGDIGNDALGAAVELGGTDSVRGAIWAILIVHVSTWTFWRPGRSLPLRGRALQYSWRRAHEYDSRAARGATRFPLSDDAWNVACSCAQGPIIRGAPVNDGQSFICTVLLQPGNIHARRLI